MLGHGEAIPEALMCIWDGCSCTCQWTTSVVADWFSVSGDEKVSLLFQQIIVHGRLEICLFLKILPISYRRGFSSGPCESGEKRVRMCSCLSGSSWNLQLLRNGSKTSFQLVLITILLRAALCSLDIYQLVNGLMLFYSEKSTQPASFTPLFSVRLLRKICKHSYSEVWVSRPRIYGMQTAADGSNHQPIDW